MTAPERTVRHLRLRAPGEAAVRRIMPTLEDALRCASLGDDGARLIVVRKLALGRMTVGASSQTLSRLIEEKAAAVSRQWVTTSGGAAGIATTDVDDGAADRSACVVFASVLAARTQLASQLLRGQRADAWYWPLAVPEFDPRLPVRHNLARIALAVARKPEAQVALPQWVAALVEGHGIRRVAEYLDEDDGDRLLAIAGLSTTLARASRAVRSGDAPTASQLATDAMSDSGGSAAGTGRPPTQNAGDDARAPRWIQRLLALAGAAPAPASTAARRAAADTLAVDPAATLRNAIATRPRALPDADTGDDGRLPDSTADRADDVSGAKALKVEPGAPTDALDRGPSAPDSRDTRAALAPAASEAWPWLQPTSCGGLLFLLPVLARLGVPRRASDDEAARRLVAAVLHQALRHSHAPPDDPMWELAAAHGEVPTQSTNAHEHEHEHEHEDEDAQAAAILVEARRWLHRAGRIGLVRLIRRRGHVSATATHVDLHFALDQCDLRLRRLGLDLDPGWVPWFGRVVAFHYGSPT
ncbi:hypothetical protein [Roseateles chitinivorans]|uniref:hypothetical protein n=1 Tax=Roseateles chitinivorans TaxID=2917965 RepID=UPI003D667D77